MFDGLDGFVLATEVGLQEIIKDVFDSESDIKEIGRRIKKDFFTIGISAAREYVDQATGRIKGEYVDVEDCIIPYSEDNRFSDIWHWGLIKLYTIGYIRQNTGLPEKDIYALAEKFSSSFGNPGLYVGMLNSIDVWDSGGIPNYNDLLVPVLEYEIKTVDSTYNTELAKPETGNYVIVEPWRKNGFGKPRTYDNEKRKTNITSISTWYKGSWIIGTQVVYNYGKKNDIPFDKKSKDARSSLQVYMAFEKSPIEMCRPILDDIQLLWLNYQRDKAQSPPNNSMAIELGSLLDNNLGGKPLHPFDTIRIWTGEGKLFYTMHPDGVPGATQQFNNVVPFQALPGGIAKSISDFASGLTLAYQQLAILSGIDQYSSNTATSPADLPATAIKTAVASTRDSLKMIYSGFVDIKERMARNIAIVGQCLCANNDDTTWGYYPILGEAKYYALQEAGQDPVSSFGIMVIALATQQEIFEIKQAAQQMTAGGKNGIPALTGSEYLFIVDRLNLGTPIESIRAYISYKERMRDKMAAEVAAQSQKLSIEGGMMQEKLKNDEERKTIAMKSTLAIKESYANAIFSAMSQIAVNKSWTVEQMKSEALKMGFDIGKTMTDQQTGQQPIQPEIPANSMEEQPEMEQGSSNGLSKQV
jgi:hypothetical protein